MSQNQKNQTSSHNSDLICNINKKIDKLTIHIKNNPADAYSLCKLVRMIGYRDELNEEQVD